MFQDVISVIAKFAFIVTPYPLILSMEIHCGSDQQIKMSKIFKETLGEDLLLDHLDGMEQGKLPSPEDLKYKILLKVIVHSRALTQIKNTSDLEEVSSDSGANSAESSTESDTAAAEPKRLPRRNSSQPGTPKASKIVPALAEMAIYTKAYKWHSFKHVDSKLFNHVFSFSEPKIKELLKNPLTSHQVKKHNLRHLMRVYPGLTRVTSNNFDPIAFWRKGVQMVALNYQKYGTISADIG
jgi:phosphatidylinositol phospholipase C, delta